LFGEAILSGAAPVRDPEIYVAPRAGREYDPALRQPLPSAVG